MKAFFVDSVQREVREVEYNGDWRTIAPLLGCQYFTVVQLNQERDTIFVDDEGLLHDPKTFFVIKGFEQPLAGNGLVLGCNEDGDSTAPRKIDLAWLNENITFPTVVLWR